MKLTAINFTHRQTDQQHNLYIRFTIRNLAPAALPPYNRLTAGCTSGHPPKRVIPLRKNWRFHDEQRSSGKSTSNPNWTEGELKEGSKITISACVKIIIIICDYREGSIRFIRKQQVLS